MKANIAIQILPTGLNDAETVRVVDEVIAYIRSTGLHYYVGPSETSIEGDDLHQLVEILENCVRIANRAGSEKVYAYTKLTYRGEGSVLTIDEKITKHHQ
ncbi:MAG: thiamine-binding protein [Oscillospiraceae bacterium]|nr:thiamine-binding protein [Oscillospiraceae bacterium]